MLKPNQSKFLDVHTKVNPITLFSIEKKKIIFLLVMLKLEQGSRKTLKYFLGKGRKIHACMYTRACMHTYINVSKIMFF